MNAQQQREAAPRWSVRIEFDTGPAFEATARASTKQGAYNLALIDARMARRFGAWNGAVVSWDARESA